MSDETTNGKGAAAGSPSAPGNGYAGKPHAAGFTANQVHMLEEMVQNLELFRTQFMSSIANMGGRDIDGACGYPLEEEVQAEYYRMLYDRSAIANRVVRLMPLECWQGCPMVYEDEDADTQTPFEEAWDALSRTLAPAGKSWYKDEEGSMVWDYLKRVDVLSGIGQFGVLLLGIDDGKNLQDPVDGVEVVLNGEWVPDSGATPREKELWREDEGLGRLTANQGVAHLEGSEEGYHRRYGKYRAARQQRQRAAKLTTTNKISDEGIGGGAPPAGAFIQGTEQQYDSGLWSGIGLKQPEGMSLSGTDQQYFGVQFGPSQAFGAPPKQERRLLFMRAFDETLVQVVRYEWNIRNPRFGLPVMYRITLNDPRQPYSGVGLPLATVYVHWSRVIHVADNLHSSEIFGMPRMKPVLNHVLDLRKVYAADGEGYWRAAFTAISAETHPELGGDVLVDKQEIRDEFRAFFEGLQRQMVTRGMTLKTLAPTVTDPTPHVNVHIEAICIQLGCPVPVFKGYEIGEQASTNNDEGWNDRRRERRLNYMTPRLIAPLVDRLIQIGVLPEPKARPKSQEDPTTTVGRMTPSPDAPPANAPVRGAAPPKPPMPGAAAGAGPPGATDAPQGPQPPKPPVGGAVPLRNNRWLVDNRRGQPLPMTNGRVRWTIPVGRYILNAAGKPVGQVMDGGYSVEWPDFDAISKKDKAAICLSNTQAVAAYVSGNVESIIPPLDFVTSEHFLGMDPEEGASILGSAVDAHDQQADIDRQTADANEHQAEPPPGFAKAPPPPPPIIATPPGMGGKPGLPNAGKGVPPPSSSTGKPAPPPVGNVARHPLKIKRDLVVAGRTLSTSPLCRTGYGAIDMKNDGSGEVWWTGSESDGEGFPELVTETLMSLDGVTKVTYWPEVPPPREASLGGSAPLWDEVWVNDGRG